MEAIMDINPEIIVELWGLVKPYIPQKERAEAAYSIIDFYDTNGDLEELAGYDNLGSTLAKALNEYLADGNEKDEDIEDDEY